MKKVHFMGIGGSGMNAVAGIAHAMGYVVSGCDFAGKPTEYTKELEAIGIPLFWEHSERHLDGIDILCVTPAVFELSSAHPEFIKARELGIVMTWQEFMGRELQARKEVISVAGTKGKTTTTALIGALLEKAAFDPTVEVGGKVVDWGKNYRIGHSNFFVCEADEYNENFVNYASDIAIITNIEFDHPEYFNSLEAYHAAYLKFISAMKPSSTLIIGIDSPEAWQLREKITRRDIHIVTYGLDSRADIYCENYQQFDEDTIHFSVSFKDGVLEEYDSRMVGQHNILNCLAVLGVARKLLISKSVCEDLFRTFGGTGRRFELVCEKRGVKVYNDYAHNPLSVSSVLDGARMKFPKATIWAVFQPHMYSRTKLLMDDFAHSFNSADNVLVTDIFASREKGKPIEKEVHSRTLVEEISQANDRLSVQYVPTNEEAVELLLARLQEGDVVVNMGAGDNGIIAELLKSRL